MIAIKDHVNALKDKALIVILEGEDALATQNARPFFLHQILHPGKKLIRVERLVGTKGDRLNLFLVVMLQAAVCMRLMIVVLVILVPMSLLMVVMITVEKRRLNIENAIEVEGITAQNRIERNFGALGLVQLGISVDAANACFDIA